MDFTESAILKFLTETGMLDPAAVKESVEQMKRNEILKVHTQKIWQGTDGSYRTYIETDSGRKMVKKKKREDLDKYLMDFYSVKLDMSFKKFFGEWVERQRACGRVGNTISKYWCDYRRVFEGYPFEKMDITEITEVDIANHIKTVLSDKKIPYRALQSAFGYLNGVFQKAIRDKVVTENPCKYLDLLMFKRYCYENDNMAAETRTLSTEEVTKLIDKLHNPINHNVNPVANLAVECAVYTGMRVSELAGLMWKDIDFEHEVITIRRSEKHDHETGEYYIDDTKNHKIRRFPLTPELRDVFERTEEYEKAKGYYGDFVFQDAEGRLHVGKISCSAFNKTGKSIHAIRRTLNSKLKCLGVPTTVAAALLGHTEQVNDSNYTYDVTDMQTKHHVIRSAYEFASNQITKK